MLIQRNKTLPLIWSKRGHGAGHFWDNGNRITHFMHKETWRVINDLLSYIIISISDFIQFHRNVSDKFVDHGRPTTSYGCEYIYFMSYKML